MATSLTGKADDGSARKTSPAPATLALPPPLSRAATAEPTSEPADSEAADGDVKPRKRVRMAPTPADGAGDKGEGEDGEHDRPDRHSKQARVKLEQVCVESEKMFSLAPFNGMIVEAFPVPEPNDVPQQSSPC